MRSYRVIIWRGAKPDYVFETSDVDAYGAAEQALMWCKRWGWRKYGVRRVERRGWVTSLDFAPPRQHIQRPRVQA
jgi:hypothetical protein